MGLPPSRRRRHRRRGRARLGPVAAAARRTVRGAGLVGLAAVLAAGIAWTPPDQRTAAVAPSAAADPADAESRRLELRARAQAEQLTAEQLAVARAALGAASGVEALRIAPEPVPALVELDDAVTRLHTANDALAPGTGALGDRVAGLRELERASAAVFRLTLEVERTAPQPTTASSVLDEAGLARLERVTSEAVAAVAELPGGGGLVDGDALLAPVRSGRSDQVTSGPLRADGTVDPAVLCPVPFAAGALLRCDAVDALVALNEEFRADHGTDLPVGSTYRSFPEQVALKGAKGFLAASPGTSHHGWGVAVDFSGFGAVGQFDTPLYLWMVEHGPAYGWIHPAGMGPGGPGPHEPWHWEFAGTALGAQRSPAP
ncbi:M15 family metallopeptidase [Cellulomonas hominis]|uniref:M15 family metallopeptidase n=1 Tax=Cellulomonas hominis TaxID=156981 RepID=UPI001B9CD2BA|nr:M15 family metallopeptidase [Cellulomonas hominis]VTR78311.1 hypothetical protein CHMI_03090 [Cellulomonas hominis]